MSAARVQSRGGSDALSWATSVAGPCCFAGVYTCVGMNICEDVPHQPGFLGRTGQTLATDPLLKGSCRASTCL